jgi:mannose-1-phosphate guanylyltransferase
MAGGTGTRLWPLSRKRRPKQFQSFVSGQTLLQETYDRVRTLLPSDHIFISTGSAYEAIVREQLPDIAPDRIIIEPETKNTGPAIGLAAFIITDRHPEAIIATLASDHAIENPEEFTATLQAAFETAAKYPDRLVTVGINPTKPDTGLGYITLGQEIGSIAGKRVFQVDSFKEKPDQKTAEAYLRNFDSLWNAGYFIFAGAALRHWFVEFAPELNETLSCIVTEKRAGTLTPQRLAALFANVPSIAIEPLIVERLSSEHRLVIPSPLEWSDIGNWNALHLFLRRESEHDMVRSGHHIDLGSRGTLVHGGKRLIATVNVKDLVIIDTDDALLVADRKSVGSDIKSLIEKLKEEGAEYL